MFNTNLDYNNGAFAVPGNAKKHSPRESGGCQCARFLFSQHGFAAALTGSADPQRRGFCNTGRRSRRA